MRKDAPPESFVTPFVKEHEAQAATPWLQESLWEPRFFATAQNDIFYHVRMTFSTMPP